MRNVKPKWARAAVLTGLVIAPAFSGAFSVDAKEIVRNASCPDCLIAQTTSTQKQASELIEFASALHCPPSGTLELAEARKENAALFPANAPVTSKEIHGFRLSGSAEELQIADELLEGRAPGGWPSAVASCRGGDGAADLRCALNGIFGSEESALRALNIGKRSGYAVSLSQEKNPAGVEQIWTAEEIRAIDQGLKDLPASFQKMKTFKKFFRVEDTYVYCEEQESPNPCLPKPDTAAVAHSAYSKSFGIAPGYIVMYSGAFKPDPTHARTVTLHEMAHEFDFGSQTNGRKLARQELGFEELSWYPERRSPSRSPLPESCFQTPYSRASAAEDFAEAVENYLSDPDTFREKCPKKYAHIGEKIYGGIKKDIRQWPPMGRALASGNDRTDAILEVLKCLKHIGVSQKTAKPVIWEPDPKNSSMFSGQYREGFVLRSRCLQSAAAGVVSKMSTEESTQACMLGARGLADALITQIGPALESLWDTAFAYAETPPEMPCKPVKKPGMFFFDDAPDKECFWNAFARERLDSDTKLKAIVPAPRIREISDELQRLVTGDPFGIRR